MNRPLEEKSNSSATAGLNAGKRTVICEAKSIVWSVILTITKLEINCILKIHILIVHIAYINTSVLLLMRLTGCLELTNTRIRRNCIHNSASSNFVLENNFNDL